MSGPSIPHETNFHRTAQSSGKGWWQSGDWGASAYDICWLGDEVRSRPRRPASTKEQGSEAGCGSNSSQQLERISARDGGRLREEDLRHHKH